MTIGNLVSRYFLQHAEELLEVENKELPLIAFIDSGNSDELHRMSNIREDLLRKRSLTEGLTIYLPVETITLYIAVVASLGFLKQIEPISWINIVQVYLVFIGFTPLFLLLVFLGECRHRNVKPFTVVHLWPWWELFASTIAFSIWGAAIPGHPFSSSAESAVAFGLAALLISPIFTSLHKLLGPISHRQNYN